MISDEVVAAIHSELTNGGYVQPHEFDDNLVFGQWVPKMQEAGMTISTKGDDYPDARAEVWVTFWKEKDNQKIRAHIHERSGPKIPRSAEETIDWLMDAMQGDIDGLAFPILVGMPKREFGMGDQR